MGQNLWNARYIICFTSILYEFPLNSYLFLVNFEIFLADEIESNNTSVGHITMVPRSVNVLSSSELLKMCFGSNSHEI